MRWRYILNISGILYSVLGLSMLLPMITGLWYRDTSALSFAISAGVATLAGLTLYFSFPSSKEEYISPREGIAIVSAGWIGAAFFGALPFYFFGALPSFTDCFFKYFL